MSRTRSSTKAFVTLSAALLVVASAHAAPEMMSLEKSSKLTFSAFTRVFDVEGTFGNWHVTARIDPDDLASAELNVNVDVASLATGLNARDEHLRNEDFLFVEKHPNATFTSSRVEVKSDSAIVVTGDLSIRGISKQVSVPVRITRSADDSGSIGAAGVIRINRHDFGVSYKGGLLVPKIDDNVDIGFDVRLAPAIRNHVTRNDG